MITLDRLKEALHYDEQTGLFTRKIKINNRSLIGTNAGYLKKNGYITITIDYKPYYAHRLAFFYVNGVWPKNQLDHINGIKNDNRITNLREVNNAENMQNHKKSFSNNKTGLLGCCFNTKANKFMAQITIDGNLKYLGLFKTAQQAHKAYLNAKHELHEFGTL